ncbi:MAG: tetratricopeptide repeat protein [Bryobacteraceae bacterium]
MICLDEAYRPRSGQFVAAIAGGMHTIDALVEVYGRNVVELDAELRQYLRRSTLNAVVFNMRLVKISDNLPAAPADPFDVALTLADINNRRGLEQQTGDALGRLAAQHPARSEPHQALGYLELRTAGSEAAIAHFRKAYELGSRNPRFLYDYGRIAAGRDINEGIRALSDLLAAEPNRADVRLDLASMQLSARRHRDAFDTLLPLKQVTPEQAPKLFRALAYAAQGMGDREEARKAASRWSRHASGAEAAEANRFLEYLDNAERAREALPQSLAQPFPDPSGDAPRRLLRRPDEPEEVAPPPPKEVKGDFVRLECNQEPGPHLVLAVDSRELSFLIDQPDDIVLMGKGTDTVELRCGPQPKTPVRIEFADPGDSHPGVTGLLRVLDFNPERD